MEEYLKTRITHLKKTEMEFFDKSIDRSYSTIERSVYRNFSNEFCARRQELEQFQKFINEATVRA